MTEEQGDEIIKILTELNNGMSLAMMLQTFIMIGILIAVLVKR